MPTPILPNVSMFKNTKINDILKVEPELEKYQKCMSLQVTLKKAQNGKKCSIASINLPVGTCVHNEKPAAHILKTDYLKDLCHHCLGYFTRNKNPLGMPKIFLSEGEENPAIYCSTKCKNEAKKSYNLISPFIHKIAKISKDTGIENDLLKLVITILAQNAVNNDNNRIIDLILELPDYEEKDIEEIMNWYKKLRQAIKQCHDVLPENLKISEEKLYELACKVSTYALSPSDLGHSNPEVGYGIYPLVSLLFRQSCNPNCLLTYQGTNVEIYTVRPVKVGEELTISYIDLYQSRYERGQELYMKRHEWCDCERCQEDINTSVDKYLCGLLCDECHKDVYPVESNGFVEYNSKVNDIKEKNEKRREKIRELVEVEFEKLKLEHEKEEAKKAQENNGEVKKEGEEEEEVKKEEEPVKEEPTKEEPTEEEPTEEEEKCHIIGVDENEVYTCPSCQHQRNKARTLEFLQRVANEFVVPLSFIQSGQFSVAEGFLTKIMERYTKFLHPQSYYLMNARVQLINCYICQEKWEECIPLAKEIISIKEKSNVYPSKHYPELIDLYEGLGDYCSQGLVSIDSSVIAGTAKDSDIKKKYLVKERSKAYNTCYDLRSVVYGKNHPKTLAIKRKIDAL